MCSRLLWSASTTNYTVYYTADYTVIKCIEHTAMPVDCTIHTVNQNLGMGFLAHHQLNAPKNKLLPSHQEHFYYVAKPCKTMARDHTVQHGWWEVGSQSEPKPGHHHHPQGQYWPEHALTTYFIRNMWLGAAAPRATGTQSHKRQHYHCLRSLWVV